MIGYVKHFNNNNNNNNNSKDKKTITMSFDATNKKLLKKYSKIWRKISNLLNKKFDSESVYGDKHKNNI